MLRHVVDFGLLHEFARNAASESIVVSLLGNFIGVWPRLTALFDLIDSLLRGVDDTARVDCLEPRCLILDELVHTFAARFVFAWSWDHLLLCLVTYENRSLHVLLIVEPIDLGPVLTQVLICIWRWNFLLLLDNLICHCLLCRTGDVYGGILH